MPVVRVLFLLLAGCIAPAFLAAAEPLELIGYVEQDKVMLFALREPQSKVVSNFLPLGRSFRGFTLEAYDAEKATLTLRRGDDRLTLILPEAKIESVEAAAARKREAMHPSKRVTITGAVREEGSLEPNENTTIAEAVALSGGFKPGANLKQVMVRRPKKSNNGVEIHVLDCNAPVELAFKLQPGDSLHIPERNP